MVYARQVIKSIGRVMKPVFKFVSGVAVTGLIVLAVAICWFLFTESGLQFIAKRTQAALPDLNIARVEGTLAGGVSLTGIHYLSPEFQFRSKEARFQFAPGELFDRTVQVNQLHLKGTQVTLSPSENKNKAVKDDSPITIPDIDLPVAIELDSIQLDDFSLVMAKEQVYQVDHFFLSAQLTDQILLKALSLDIPKQEKIPGIQISASGNAGLKHPHDLLLKVNWLTSIEQTGELTGSLLVEGNPDNLVLKNRLQPFDMQLDVTLEQPLRSLDWQADLLLPALQWPLPAKDGQVKPDPMVSDKPKPEPPVAIRQLRIKGQGDLKNYRLNLNTRLQAHPLPWSDWQLTVKGNRQQIFIEQLVGHLLEGRMKANGVVHLQPAIQGSLELDTENIKLTGLWPEWPRALSMQNRLQAEFTDKTVSIRQLTLDLPPTAASLGLTGDVRLEPNGHSDIKLAWQNLQWPLSNDPQVKSRQGNLEVSGNREAWHLDLTGQVAGNQVPDTNIKAKADGNQQGLKQIRMGLALLDGELNIAGQANWKPRVNWDIRLTGEGVNPGKQWPEWPGKLALDLETRGAFTDRLEAALNLHQLKGQLRQYPLLAESRVLVDGQDYLVKQFELLSGSNRIAGNGRFQEDQGAKVIAAQVDVKAPDLSGLLPQAKGRLDAGITVSGHLDAPQLAMTLSGNDLGFEQWLVDKLDGKIDLDVSKDRLWIELMAKQFTQSGQPRLNNVSLNTKGKISAHKITASLATPKEALKLAANGGYEQQTQTWSGRLEDMRILTEPFGNWQLAGDAQVYLSKQKVRLEKTCLESEPVRAGKKVVSLCTRLDWQPDKSLLNLELRDLPAGFVAAPWLPGDMEIYGTDINADMTASLVDNRDIRSTATITLTKGRVKTVVGGEKRELTHGGGKVDLTVDESGLQADGRLALLGKSHIQANAALPGFNHLPPGKNQSVEASLDTRIEDVNLLPVFVPLIEKANGVIKGIVRVAGNLAKPRVNANISLKDASLFIPSAGLSLEKINGSLIANEQGKATSTIDLVSGEGWLKIKTDATYSNPKSWLGKVQVTGNNLTAVDVPDVTARVSPDISLQVKPGGIIVNGNIDIPSADITPNLVVGESGSGTTAVTASRDVSIVDTEQESAGKKDKKTFNLDGQLGITLGDNINLSVVGFNSRIAGGLEVLFDPTLTLPNALGEVQIVDGRFRKFGQELVIDRGRVVFTGGAVDNPALDIKAYRPIREAGRDGFGLDKVDKAGVHIRGRLRHPQLVLFSEPTMEDDTNILSYIVTGSAYAGNKRTELSLGTYLRPNLFVSFAFDIFEAEKTFNMRYDFNKWLGVEGVTGDRESGVDFSYRLSK
ncbi:MAG: hypothetical protein CSB48_11390 [Proteobacteria bacterium]|nr:MAG: hypothetical protein CSB48_11390 [Pseudomonadota bacterium]